jgi:hypothetical protein
MLETIAGFVGNIAIYIAALLGLIVVYFLWVAFREWRVSQRAAFGVERDIASSEMIGALLRAGGVVVVAVILFALGQLAQGTEVADETTAQATQPPLVTLSVLGTPTAASGTSVPPAVATDTSQPAVTEIPPLPSEPTQTAPVEPARQTATVIIFGGVWLRDAPNGGTIGVLPQGSVVEFLEGREFAGSFEWQKVTVLSTPPGSEALVDREGWVALTPEFLEVSP